MLAAQMEQMLGDGGLTFYQDVERQNDASDPEYEVRNTALSADVDDAPSKQTPPQLYKLIEACEDHSLEGTESDSDALTY